MSPDEESKGHGRGDSGWRAMRTANSHAGPKRDTVMDARGEQRLRRDEREEPLLISQTVHAHPFCPERPPRSHIDSEESDCRALCTQRSPLSLSLGGGGGGGVRPVQDETPTPPGGPHNAGRPKINDGALSPGWRLANRPDAPRRPRPQTISRDILRIPPICVHAARRLGYCTTRQITQTTHACFLSFLTVGSTFNCDP